MSIEIGSVWRNKTHKSWTVKVISVSPSADFMQYATVTGDRVVSTCDTSWFLSHYELSDMVNHPPHYKDASGIECIEVTKQGRKDDSTKRRYSLLPTGTVNHVVDVLEFGAIKYAPDNWQKVPDARKRYYDAAMRHIDSWFGGEVKDIETGLPHLAHAVCCLLFLIWFDNKA